MTDYTWVGGTSTTASTAANWNPSGVPNSSSHTATFANAVACNWDIAACGVLYIKAGYTGMVTFANAVALTGLKVDVKETIDAAAARIITFSGTPPYNSGKSHIYYNGFSTGDSPFRNAAARAYITFTMNGSSRITYDSGVYPHILLTNGSHTPDYATITGTRENKINFLSLTVNSGATFAPASATPTTNDRLRKWVSDTAAQSQFAISSGVATFNGGYAEWTFQAISSGFIIPTSGTTTYNQCKFTFDKMVLDASVGGVGRWAKITAATRLSLNDLTINTGASLKGSHATIGCAIFLVNKPTIHGTWAFLPFADGMYVYPKTGETLGYVDGGTGLNALGSANQVLATNAGATAMEWQTVSSGSGDITGVTIQTDSGSGSKATDTAGSADFSILGTAGVGVTNSGVTITATAVPGEIDHDSLQNFVAAEHVDWAGASAGTIHASNHADTNTQLSNAQVRTAVEAATDSNVFTDADHTKLNGVEASADVTDATNVAAAGAVMGGTPISAFPNDAGYLTAATTPTAVFAKFTEINHSSNRFSRNMAAGTDHIIEGSENWNTEVGNATLLACMNQTAGNAEDGVITFTAATVGTYQINMQVQFAAGSSSDISETAGKYYKLQLLPMYLAAGGSFPSGALLKGYTRQVNDHFYIGNSLQTTVTLTFADGDKFWVETKIATDASGTNFRIAGAANTGFSNLWLELIKIA